MQKLNILVFAFIILTPPPNPLPGFFTPEEARDKNLAVFVYSLFYHQKL